MRRSPSESSFCVVPGCGMQIPPPQARVFAFTGIVNGPLNVDFAVFVKSTWKRYRCREVEVERSTKKAGSPDGGGVEPSAFEGRKENSLGFLKQTALAGAPV